MTRFLIQGVGQGGAALCGFLSTLVIVRALGPVGFGELSVGFAVLTYAIVIATFGTDVRAIQMTARHPQDLAENLRAVLAVRAILTLPTIALVWLISLSGVWEPATASTIQVLLLSVGINIVSTLWAAQAAEAARTIAFFTFSAQAMNLAFVVWMQSLGYGLMGFAAARVLSDALAIGALLCWTMHQLKDGRTRPRQLPVLGYLRESLPFGITQLLRTIALASDLILADFFAPPYDVGIYAAAYRIFTLLIGISAIYSVVVLPSIVRSAKEGEDQLREALKKRLKWPGLAVAGTLVLAIWWTPTVLAVVFGNEFAAGSLVFNFLLVALVANFWSRGYRCALIATGQQVGEMRATSFATLANLAIKLVLTPFIGLTGLAIGTLTGEVVQAFLQRRLVLRRWVAR